MLFKPHELFFGTPCNEIRFQIIQTLQKGPKNVAEICKKVKCDRTTISHNLTRLRTCGFVMMEKNGKQRIYRLNKETISPLIDLMNKHIKKYCGEGRCI